MKRFWDKVCKESTEESVIEIKALLLSGAKQSDIGYKFHVSQDTISLIANGKRWKHVV